MEVKLYENHNIVEKISANAFGEILYNGNIELMEREKLAFFCSSRCPGSVILKTYDFANNVSRSETVVMSGFHSPVEQELLKLLLDRHHPVIVCPARSIKRMRVPAEYKTAISEDRMLILSPFKENQNRMTAKNAEIRNLFVASIADKILIAHAEPGGNLELLKEMVIEWGTNVITSEQWNVTGVTDR